MKESIIENGHVKQNDFDDNGCPNMPNDSELEKTFSKTKPKKETALIAKLKPLLNQVTEDDLKIYSYSKNAKLKIQFRQFPEVCFNNDQIFDHSHAFKTRSQLNVIAHKIGSDFLYAVFVSRKNILLSKKTRKYIEREELRNFRGQLSDLIDDYKDSLDLFNKKIISQHVFDADVSDYIESFDSEEKQTIAAKVIDDLIKSGADVLSKDRIRKEEKTKEERKWELRYSKLKEVI
jgi:hypothetical protein